MRKVDEKILSYFTKDELIDCILQTQWLFNPMTVLFENMRYKTSIENKKILCEAGNLVKKMKGQPLQEQYKISNEIDKLYKKADKNRLKIEKLTNIYFEREGKDD